jgi:hypothetical protein
MWEIYLNFILLSLNCFLWLIQLPKLRQPLKILGCILVITLIAESFAFQLLKKKENNLFIFHLLVPLQFIFYTMIFYFESKRRSVKRIMVASIVLVCIMSIALSLKTQGIDEYNSYVTMARHFFLVIWILLFFRRMLVEVEIPNPLHEPMFWISTGLLFYSLGSFFIEGYMNMLIDAAPEVAKRLYFVNVLLGLFMYLLFLAAFLTHTSSVRK